MINWIFKINNKKSFGIIFLFCLIFSININAQLQSIRAYADYSPVLGKRMEVYNASAMGAEIQIKYKLAGNFSAGLTTGYKLYSISQTNQLWQWNWRFWNDRYSNTIQSNLQADPSLSVEIGSVQKMDAIPVILDLDYTYNLNEKVDIVPSASFGVMFFTRRLYAVETWSKKFEQLNYTFTYSYRNFAPDKKGNPLLASGGFDVNYRMFSDVNLIGGIHYTYFIPTGNSFGYGNFPFKDELNINLGFNFIY